MSACPTCGKEIGESTTTFPFCSERCRMADLSRWFTEDYRIPIGRSTSEIEMPDPEEG